MFNKIAMPAIEDAATVSWLAGILEGEGTFGLSKGRISVTISMTDKISSVALRNCGMWPVTQSGQGKRIISPLTCVGL